MALYTKDNCKIQDDYKTPIKIWRDIMDYIPKDKKIWAPFYYKGDHTLKELGFDIIHQEEDFFKVDRGEIVVDNPPFSIKKQVLERLVKLDKPFILIMPASTLCYKYARIIKDKIQIIIPNGRVKYLDNGKSPSFDSLYYCYKMNLPKDIIYLEDTNPPKVKKPRKPRTKKIVKKIVNKYNIPICKTFDKPPKNINN